MAAETFEPGRGPGPAALDDTAMIGLLASQQFGVLATTKRDGTPHMSTMIYTWDAAARIIRISTRAGRAKVGHIERDGRAALHVSNDDHLSWVVAEGTAEVSPASTEPGDATGLELLSMQPDHDTGAERDTFLANMVADERLVIRLRVRRLYGAVLGS